MVAVYSSARTKLPTTTSTTIAPTSFRIMARTPDENPRSGARPLRAHLGYGLVARSLVSKQEFHELGTQSVLFLEPGRAAEEFAEVRRGGFAHAAAAGHASSTKIRTSNFSCQLAPHAGDS